MWEARASRRRLHARALVLASGLAGAFVMTGFAPASAQGLFESLFGGGFFQPERPRIYAPPPHALPDFGYERRRATPKRITREPDRQRIPRQETSKPEPYVPPEVMPGPLGRFLRDPSLRRGDIVATANGLMVFRGSAGARHSTKDFVPVAKAGSLVKRGIRAELAKLDGAVRTGPDPAAETLAKSAPIVAQDEALLR